MTRDTILVTGGAGFIGSELVRQLAEHNSRVVIVDNLVNGTRQNVADVLSERVLLDVSDVRDLDAVGRHLGRVHAVYHLACLGVRHSVHSPHENHDVNATATLRLLDACRRAGVEKFVYVSSSEVYGTARRVPMTEEHPTFPCTVYGASKLAGECYTRAFHQTYGYPTVVVRPFNTYGPRSHHEGDSGEVIPRFLLRCLAGRPMVVFGDGTQTRDFTYVSDTAAGIRQAGESSAAIGATINLGSGREVTIVALAREIAALVGSAKERRRGVPGDREERRRGVPGDREARVEHDVPRPGDVLRLCADTSLAASLVGYRPQVSLAEGLRRLHAWYEAQGVAPEELLEREVVRNWVRQ